MKRVLRIKEIKKSPVGQKEASSQGLAILVSARPPTGAFYSALKQNSKKMQENPTPYENFLINKLIEEKVEFKFQQIFPPYTVYWGTLIKR